MEKQTVFNILSSVSLLFALIGIMRFVQIFIFKTPASALVIILVPVFWLLALVLSIISIRTENTVWGIILLTINIILFLIILAGLIYIYLWATTWSK